MSFVNPSNNKPGNGMAKRGGGGMLFLIVLAAGAFLLFSNMNRGDANTGKVAPDSAGTTGVERGNVSGLEPDTHGKQMPTTGRDGAQSGWEMDGVDGNPKGNAKLAPRQPKTAGTWKASKTKKTKRACGFPMKRTTPPKIPIGKWKKSTRTRSQHWPTKLSAL